MLDANNWNENERRVFIWFIIFYTYFKDISSNDIVSIISSRPLKSGTVFQPPSSTRILSSCIFNCSIWSNRPRKSAGPKKKTKGWWRKCKGNKIGDGMRLLSHSSIIPTATSSKLPSIAVNAGSTISTTRRNTDCGHPKKTWESSNLCYSLEKNGVNWSQYWKTHALNTWSRIDIKLFYLKKKRKCQQTTMTKTKFSKKFFEDSQTPRPNQTLRLERKKLKKNPKPNSKLKCKLKTVRKMPKNQSQQILETERWIILIYPKTNLVSAFGPLHFKWCHLTIF